MVDEPDVERDWSYTSKQFAGDGYVLVGDAACFVDPLFSSGVHLALGSATLAANYVKSALEQPKARDQAAQLYESLYRKQYDYFHLTAQLFYGTNRSADSYFWEARRILGDDDTTPREKPSCESSADNRRRATSAPSSSMASCRSRSNPKSVAVIKRAERRRRETEALTAEPGALLRAVPTLPAHVKLEQRRALAGANFQQAFQLVVETSQGRSEPFPVTAVMAACIGQMNGRTSLGDIVATVNRQHNLRGEQGLRTIIERDLPPLIEAGLVDVTTRNAGRNDPCPCGSGKKYKRCHGR